MTKNIRDWFDSGQYVGDRGRTVKISDYEKEWRESMDALVSDSTGTGGSFHGGKKKKKKANDDGSGLYKLPPYKRCADSHKPLKLPGNLQIHGGYCGHPAVKADVYIGFDGVMRLADDCRPWEGKYAVYFHIEDCKAPRDASEFKKLVDWTIEQLQAGKKVHVGCIGGHGRTGTFLAAIYAQLSGDKAAIEYVRANYCNKAVESAAQISFLMHHFGVDKAEPRKEFTGLLSPTGLDFSKARSGNDGGLVKLGKRGLTTGRPLHRRGNIWGANAMDDCE
jgi:hypothetical protein